MNILKTYRLFKLEFAREIHMFGTYLKKYYILCKTHKQYKPVSTKKTKLRVHKQASQQGCRSIQVRLPFLAFVCFGIQWLTPHPCLSFSAALGKRDNMVGMAIERRDHISGRKQKSPRPGTSTISCFHLLWITMTYSSSLSLLPCCFRKQR